MWIEEDVRHHVLLVQDLFLLCGVQSHVPENTALHKGVEDGTLRRHGGNSVADLVPHRDVLRSHAEVRKELRKLIQCPPGRGLHFFLSLHRAVQDEAADAVDVVQQSSRGGDYNLWLRFKLTFLHYSVMTTVAAGGFCERYYLFHYGKGLRHNFS